MENKIVRVHSSKLDTFNTELKVLNNKFAKKNLPVVNAELLKEYDLEEYEVVQVPYPPFAEEIKVINHYFDIELSSEFNQKNISGVDVQFEGVVDLIEKNENAKVFKLTDTNLFKYLDNCQCDECKKSIGRNKYIVFSKVGKPVESRDDLIVLGSTCAKNYFPFDIVSYFGDLQNFYTLCFGGEDDSMGFGHRDSNYINIQRLFHLVGSVTDDFKVYEKDGGTRNQVAYLLSGKRDKNTVYVEPKTNWEDMKEWLKAAYSEIKDEFTGNIHSVIFDPYSEELKLRDEINLKYLGLACYAFVGAKRNHDKELERIAREKAYKDGTADEYFGEVGSKFEKELMFEKEIGFEGYYGYTYFLFFRDEEGRVFKWSTGNATYEAYSTASNRNGFCDYEVGEKYLMKGTIKDHSEYKGVKQTVITRCKVLKDHYESHIFSKKEIDAHKNIPTFRNEAIA